MGAVWTIEAIRTADLRTPGPEVFFQRDFTRQVELAIYSFVLRGPAATVVVDTGLGEHAALNRDVRMRKGEWAGFQAVVPPPAALDGLGADDVVLTTFGPYAIGGLDRWPDARVHYSARGWDDLQRPEVPLFRRSLPPAIRTRLAGSGGQAVRDRARIHPGLEIVELGGHSPSAMGVVVDTAAGRIAIADPVFHAETLTRGLPLGWVESLREWYGVFARLGPSVDAILPIHDPSATPVPRHAWHPDLRSMADAGGRSS